MLSKNIRVYVEILPSFAVEGGNDILQHPVLDGWGRHASILASQLKRFVIEQQLVKRELTTNDNAETSF